MSIPLFLLFGIALGFGSCIPSDTRVEPVPRLAQDFQVNMESNYTKQIFFDLSSGSIVKEQPKTLWDFGIDPQSNSIVTNTGRFIHAGTTDHTSLTGDLDTSGIHLAFDSANGQAEHRALADYKMGEVFLMDLGYNLEGWNIGQVWVQVIESANAWEVKYRYSNSDSILSGTLTKETGSGFSYFSLLSGEQVNAEPNQEDYDLIFRQYIYYFNEEKLPYFVTGALLNWNGVQAYEAGATDPSFEYFTLSDVDASKFSNEQDVIGYNWKFFDFDAQTYVTASDRLFIVEDQEGFLYKIRFTSFYSDTGEKGSPLFEMVLL